MFVDQPEPRRQNGVNHVEEPHSDQRDENGDRNGRRSDKRGACRSKKGKEYEDRQNQPNDDAFPDASDSLSYEE